MSLLLVTGPANAAKAREVFGRLRAAHARDPLLVVPTGADADHYRRELADARLVLGPEVVTFAGLVREIGRATQTRPRTIAPLARARLIEHVVAQAELTVLATSASAPGFADAFGRFLAELRQARADPAGFAEAMRRWAGEDARRQGYATDLATLFAAYDRALEELGRVDPGQAHWDVLTALREEPTRWPGRPVFFYGWDDLSRVQRDAVLSLADPRTGADVVLSLVHEPGRAAFAARASLVADLTAQIKLDHVHVAPSDEHYAPTARGALHHLERFLFEDDVAPASPNGAIRLLESGGARAEAELVGAEVLELLREGIAPHELAIVMRAGAADRLAFAEILAGLGIPVAPDATIPAAATALGAGLLALARAALPGGTAQDLVRWLRTPGRLSGTEAAAGDVLERRVRRGEVEAAADARDLWETTSAPLTELDRIAAAAMDGPVEMAAALVDELKRTWTRPYTREAALLDAHGHADARLVAALTRAARDFADLAQADPALAGGHDDVLRVLGAVEVPAPGAQGTGGVLVTEPRAIRARRFRAVVVAGLQDGVFPRSPSPDPFLDDAERRALARIEYDETTGARLELPPREEGLAQERFLFYACASRPTDVLLLSFRTSDEDGEPEQPSPFVDDVRRLYGPELWDGRGHRMLSDVAWPPASAPTQRELERSLAAATPEESRPLGAPTTEPVRRMLAQRDSESARGLEVFASCPVRWLVEHVLQPSPIDPDALPLRRGSLAHVAMERTLAGLKAATGSARLTPERLDEAKEALAAALAELARSRTLREGGVEAKVLLRDLEAKLARALEYEAATGPGLEPELLEWSFGTEGGAPPLEIGGMKVRGRVDRVDVDPDRGTAIVRDYKGAAAPPHARWEEERHVQVALYALAVQQDLGLTPVAGVYQPLRKPDARARGLVRDDAPAGDGHFVDNDVVDPQTFDAVLATARGIAEQAADGIRAGRIRACPDTCSPRGCAYPTICRGEPRDEDPPWGRR